MQSTVTALSVHHQARPSAAVRDRANSGHASSVGRASLNDDYDDDDDDDLDDDDDDDEVRMINIRRPELVHVDSGLVPDMLAADCADDFHDHHDCSAVAMTSRLFISPCQCCNYKFCPLLAEKKHLGRHPGIGRA